MNYKFIVTVIMCLVDNSCERHLGIHCMLTDDILLTVTTGLARELNKVKGV